MQKRIDGIQHQESKEACVSPRAKRLARAVGWGALLSVVLLAAYGFWGASPGEQSCA